VIVTTSATSVAPTGSVSRTAYAGEDRGARVEPAREAMRQFISDLHIDRLRVAYQGYRPGHDRIVWSKYKGRYCAVANAEHRARLAIADGTIKMLTTSALPRTPSRAFVFSVDRNARTDEDRRGTRHKKITRAATTLERAWNLQGVPARGKRRPSLSDIEDGWVNPSVDTADTPDARVDPPITLIDPTATTSAVVEAVVTAPTAEQARQALTALATQAGVNERDFGFLVDRLGRRKPATYALLGRGAGISGPRVCQRVTRAVSAIAAAARTSEETVATMFVRAFLPECPP